MNGIPLASSPTAPFIKRTMLNVNSNPPSSKLDFSSKYYGSRISSNTLSSPHSTSQQQEQQHHHSISEQNSSQCSGIQAKFNSIAAVAGETGSQFSSSTSNKLGQARGLKIPVTSNLRTILTSSQSCAATPLNLSTPIRSMAMSPLPSQQLSQQQQQSQPAQTSKREGGINLNLSKELYGIYKKSPSNVFKGVTTPKPQNLEPSLTSPLKNLKCSQKMQPRDTEISSARISEVITSQKIEGFQRSSSGYDNSSKMIPSQLDSTTNIILSTDLVKEHSTLTSDIRRHESSTAQGFNQFPLDIQNSPPDSRSLLLMSLTKSDHFQIPEDFQAPASFLPNSSLASAQTMKLTINGGTSSGLNVINSQLKNKTPQRKAQETRKTTPESGRINRTLLGKNTKISPDNLIRNCGSDGKKIPGEENKFGFLGVKNTNIDLSGAIIHHQKEHGMVQMNQQNFLEVPQSPHLDKYSLKKQCINLDSPRQLKKEGEILLRQAGLVAELPKVLKCQNTEQNELIISTLRNQSSCNSNSQIIETEDAVPSVLPHSKVSTYFSNLSQIAMNNTGGQSPASGLMSNIRQKKGSVGSGEASPSSQSPSAGRYQDVYSPFSRHNSPNKQSLFQRGRNGSNLDIQIAPGSPMMMSQWSGHANGFPGPRKKCSSNLSILDQSGFQAKERSRNIKTFLRIRPQNQIEIELSNQNLGRNIIEYIGKYSVTVQSDPSVVYTFDRVFQPQDNQDAIYEEAGKEVIEDVFKGYNGTIFTYGVTGSGKTFTMFGRLESKESNDRGLIPRIANDIFSIAQKGSESQSTTEDQTSTTTEFIINCSMLEIYKETLYDSFAASNSTKNELKIKENLSKGVHVQGLTQTSVSTYEELMSLIQFGYNTKRTRETKLNEYSSRSHTLFMIEVLQRISNGDEKVGRINLIDLAGAEKVSRSGASGESLEEAIQINLSLSSLGNVIHSLTNGNDHIPYRDSKLTRILQESLSGNYKTSLIVTCSGHSIFGEETQSSLKFASRAKNIKTTFQMNIKKSDANIQKEIEELRIQAQSYKYIFSNLQNLYDSPNLQNFSDPTLTQVRTCLEEVLCLQKAIEESSDSLPMKKMISSKRISETNTSFFEVYLAQKRDSEKSKQQEQIKQLESTVSEQREKIEELQKQNTLTRQLNLSLSAKINELTAEKHSLSLKLNKETYKKDFSAFSQQILDKQISQLVNAVCVSEKKLSTTLQAQKMLQDQKLHQFLQETVEFQEIQLSDTFIKPININFEEPEKVYKDVQCTLKRFSLTKDLDDVDGGFGESNQSHSQFCAESLAEIVQLDYKYPKTPSFVDFQTDELGGKKFYSENAQLLQKNFEMPSKLCLPSPTQTDQGKKDFAILVLKKHLIDANMINQNLLRSIIALGWKQSIEAGKYKLKNEIINMQKSHIHKLESAIEDITQNHKDLRLQIDRFSFDIDQFHQSDSHNISSNQKSKNLKPNQIIIPVNEHNLQRHLLINKQNQAPPLSQSPDNQKSDYLIGMNSDLDLEVIPLTYDNALVELKRRNIIIKRLTCSNQHQFSGIPTESIIQGNESFLQDEKENLKNKIDMLQQELKMAYVKVESIKKSLELERKESRETKRLTEEMEESLKKTLLQEIGANSQSIKQISDNMKSDLTNSLFESLSVRDNLQKFKQISLQKFQQLKEQMRENNSLNNQIQELDFVIGNFSKSIDQLILPNQDKPIFQSISSNRLISKKLIPSPLNDQPNYQPA